jgi:hypothetical protein
LGRGAFEGVGYLEQNVSISLFLSTGSTQKLI